MRPVEKWDLTNADGTPKTYPSGWGYAKTELIENLGDYCSFCERPAYAAGIDVEHIQPKGLPQYESLKYRWDNFLLGCKNCNPI